jgi:hypothetical protein
MKINKHTKRWFFLIIITLCASPFIYSQVKFSPEQQKTADYLNNYFEKHNKRLASLNDEFAEFLPIESKLETDLLKAFPKHRFFIAKTYYSHWGLRDNESKILVVANAQTNEPLAHRWALWYAGFSESFAHILETYSFESKDEAKEKIKLFSALIVSLGRSGGEVGEIKVEKKEISVDLDNNWRIMKVRLNKNKFGKITFINPKLKAEDKSEESK